MKISSQDEEVSYCRQKRLVVYLNTIYQMLFCFVQVIVENEVEVESPVSGVYYDKSKSFFDFISSDPLPTEQGKRLCVNS